MKILRFGALAVVVSALLLLAQTPVLADSSPILVSVGYADNIHCKDFNTNPALCIFNPPATFPNPWDGSAGISSFHGMAIGGFGYDAGALLLTNNSAGIVSVTDVTVTIGGTTFDLWGSFTIPVGESVILTQTSNSVANFDTSDVDGSCCTNDGVKPKITITIGGTPMTLMDTNQILNTGGFDLGCKDSGCVLTNESHPWSLIPGQSAAVPEPSSLLLLGSGLLWLGAGVRRRILG